MHEDEEIKQGPDDDLDGVNHAVIVIRDNSNGRGVDVKAMFHPKPMSREDLAAGKVPPVSHQTAHILLSNLARGSKNEILPEDAQATVDKLKQEALDRLRGRSVATPSKQGRDLIVLPNSGGKPDA